jgi:electron transfer flavoprotein alpha subunit
MAQGVMVFIEEREGKVKKTSLEALSAARKLADQLGETVTAVRIGEGDPSENLAHYGADAVMNARHDLLQAYATEAYCGAVVEAAQKIQPRFILSAASAMGRDLMPRVAARIDAGVAQDCIEAGIVGDGQLQCVRPIYAGKAYAKVNVLTTPAIATLRPNVFQVEGTDSSRTAEMSSFTPDLSPEKIRA